MRQKTQVSHWLSTLVLLPHHRGALVLAMLVAGGWGTAPCSGQTGTQHEYELKAGVLYHII